MLSRLGEILASKYRHAGMIPTHRQQCIDFFCFVYTRVANLDGTSCHHLLPQMIFVLSNGTWPFSDGLILAHHDVLSNLVEQSEIVRNDHHTASERIDSISQTV